jgi:hypothetical protein
VDEERIIGEFLETEVRNDDWFFRLDRDDGHQPG